MVFGEEMLPKNCPSDSRRLVMWRFLVEVNNDRVGSCAVRFCMKYE